jgi:septum formation topological specificity factor MinE
VGWETSKQGLTAPIFVKGAITNQRYLQQLQNEVCQVIQEAGHVDITFFQQDGGRPHTTNVVFDVLHDVFGSSVLSNSFPERFGCRWSWPPCSPDTNPCDHFLSSHLNDRVYRTNPHTVQELQVEIEAVVEQITGDMLLTQLTTLWFVYSVSTELKDLILNMCSHEDHMHTNFPCK